MQYTGLSPVDTKGSSMVEGRVPQSSRQERFQVPCMVEGRVPQSRFLAW